MGPQLHLRRAGPLPNHGQRVCGEASSRCCADLSAAARNPCLEAAESVPHLRLRSGFIRLRHPVRVRCTRRTREPLDLVVRPQAEHEPLQRHRQEQGIAAWQESHGRRAGVEGTISQAIRGPDMRRARYGGLAKVQLRQILSATALSLLRIDAWLTDTPLARTRTSHLDTPSAVP
ncbi:transposase [Streptomyces sp. NPDC088560]|uniref:transposase n=1 Tax=Streptomyces sp. NPDC088560 TaxID=3365868 RepID=UPI0037F7A421